MNAFKNYNISEYEIYFNEAGSCQMEGIISLYNYINSFLVCILFLVTTALLVIIASHTNGERYIIKVKEGEEDLFELVLWMRFLQKWTHSTNLELIWTVIPTLLLVSIAVPSFILLYSLDEIVDTQSVIRIIAYQWYWKYEYPTIDFLLDDILSLSYLSYMLPLNDLTEENNLRLLEVDYPLILPTNVNCKLIITSKDVIHSFAVPSLGIKMDAVPGRLNQVTVHIFKPGVYYGQCSELCGVNHAFMPIVINAVHFSTFESFLYHASTATPFELPEFPKIQEAPKPDNDPEAPKPNNELQAPKPRSYDEDIYKLIAITEIIPEIKPFIYFSIGDDDYSEEFKLLTENLNVSYSCKPCELPLETDKLQLNKVEYTPEYIANLITMFDRLMEEEKNTIYDWDEETLKLLLEYKFIHYRLEFDEELGVHNVLVLYENYGEELIREHSPEIKLPMRKIPIYYNQYKRVCEFLELYEMYVQASDLLLPRHKIEALFDVINIRRDIFNLTLNVIFDYNAKIINNNNEEEVKFFTESAIDLKNKLSKIFKLETWGLINDKAYVILSYETLEFSLTAEKLLQNPLSLEFRTENPYPLYTYRPEGFLGLPLYFHNSVEVPFGCYDPETDNYYIMEYAGKRETLSVNSVYEFLKDKYTAEPGSEIYTRKNLAVEGIDFDTHLEFSTAFHEKFFLMYNPDSLPELYNIPEENFIRYMSQFKKK